MSKYTAKVKTKIKQKKSRTYIDVKFKSIFIASTFSMLIEYLMSLSDKIISGNIIGSDALSAITLVEPFSLLVGFIAYLLCDITDAPVTEALGRGDQKKAEQYINQTLFLTILIGLALTIVYVVFTDSFVSAVSGTSAYKAYVRDYFLCIRFIPLPMLLNAVLYTIVLYRGGEKYCNLSALFSVLSNIGLSIGLCFGFGLKGISAATVIGTCMGIIPLVYFLFTPAGKLHVTFHFSLHDLKNNLVYSLGGSLTYLYMAIFQMLMNLFLVKLFSDNALIIFTGVVNVISLVIALSDSIVEFLVPMFGTYKGEQNDLGCRRVMEKAIKVSIIESLALTVIIFIFARMLAAVFGVENPELLNEFTSAVRIYILSTCFFYMVNLYSKYYLYIGKPLLSFIIEFLKSIVFPLTFGLGFGMLFGLKGIWIGMSIAQIVLLAAGFLIIRRNKQAGKDLLFLDLNRMKHQHMWNIQMEEMQIIQLVEEVSNILKEEGFPQNKINQAALAVEESQMHDLVLNKNPEKVIIECSMLEDPEDKDITLILRNTGICSNILNDGNDQTDLLPRTLVSRMPGMSTKYFLVNGNNRLIFHISKTE